MRVLTGQGWFVVAPALPVAGDGAWSASSEVAPPVAQAARSRAASGARKRVRTDMRSGVVRVAMPARAAPAVRRRVKDGRARGAASSGAPPAQSATVVPPPRTRTEAHA